MNVNIVLEAAQANFVLWFYCTMTIKVFSILYKTFRQTFKVTKISGIQVKVKSPLNSHQLLSLFCLVCFDLEGKESHRPEGRSYITLEKGIVLVMIDSPLMAQVR